MLLSRHFAAAALVAVGLLASCAQTLSPTLSPADIDARARKWSESAIEDYGLAKGSPREGKLRALAVRLLTDGSFVAALGAKPAATDLSEWEQSLGNEGANFLDGETLLRFFRAKARLLSEATDEECVSGVQVLTNNVSSSPILDAISKATKREVHPQVRAVWRQRLARISEEDFDALTEVPVLAMLARARRINDPLPSIAPSDHARVRQAFESQMSANLSASSQKSLIDAALAGDPMAQCKVARLLSAAQSRLSSADARIGLQLFEGSAK
jgi:hypothetical protein